MTLQSMLQPGKRAETVSEKKWPIDKAMKPFFSVSAVLTLYNECRIQSMWWRPFHVSASGKLACVRISSDD